MVKGAHFEDSQSRLLWSETYWDNFEHMVRKRALAASTDPESWKIIVNACRKVMSHYTTSFFIVSRFLPLLKRQMVEVVYAAVRYPDEVVDTFPIDQEERNSRLDIWEEAYERGLSFDTISDSLQAGVPVFLAAFARVVREKNIPPEHYISFLSAMRHDISPVPFMTLENLIENYVYGSAIVVGYFLAYVYGPSGPDRMNDVLECSHDLGIALQLTNFLRDVYEDQQRGRLYLPLNMLRSVGAEVGDTGILGDLKNPSNRRNIQYVIQRMTKVAESYYQKASARLDAFSPDCRVAIKACIDVYGKLNDRIAASPDCIGRRESVPMHVKLCVLPPGKYWRLPLALLGW